MLKDLKRLTAEDIQDFLAGSRELDFSVRSQEAYTFIEQVLNNQHYGKQSRKGKGAIRRFLMKMTSLSRAQITRLIERWGECRQVRRKPAYRPNFPRLYQPGDIALLAAMDAAHQDLSGPAIRHLLARAHQVYGQAGYARLAGISVSHIYNLRRSAAYRKLRVHVQHTQARKVSIGERRLPDPKGLPGFLRVDTVHQGSRDGMPGVFHINAVDVVTQFEVVGCVEAISEHYIRPVLEAMLHQFPFRILGFHCDNGSEFINHSVQAMLQSLLGGPQADRPRPHCLRACRSLPEVLHCDPQPLLELPSALRVRHAGGGQTWAPEADLQAQRLPDPVRETSCLARLDKNTQAWYQRQNPGPTGR